MPEDKPKTVKILTVFFKNGRYENFHNVAVVDGAGCWTTWSEGGPVLAFTFGQAPDGSRLVGRGHAEMVVKNIAGFAVWESKPNDV